MKTILTIATGIILIIGAFTAGISWGARPSTAFGSSISTASGATCLTLAGLGVLLFLLMGLIAVYSKLGMASKENALGLPEGSIRALLSLGLLVVFVTLSFFLYNQLSAIHLETQRHVSEEEVKNIPADQIFDKEDERTPEDVTAKKPAMFAVRRIVQPTKSGEDLAKQIFTTISNLLIAIASFYFGASAVSSANSAGAASAGGGAKPGTPTLGQIEDKVTATEVVLIIHGSHLQDVNKVNIEGADGKIYMAPATSNESLVTTQKFDPLPPAGDYVVVLLGPEGKELARSAGKHSIPAA